MDVGFIQRGDARVPRVVGHPGQEGDKEITDQVHEAATGDCTFAVKQQHLQDLSAYVEWSIARAGDEQIPGVYQQNEGGRVAQFAPQEHSGESSTSLTFQQMHLTGVLSHLMAAIATLNAAVILVSAATMPSWL